MGGYILAVEFTGWAQYVIADLRTRMQFTEEHRGELDVFWEDMVQMLSTKKVFEDSIQKRLRLLFE